VALELQLVVGCDGITGCCFTTGGGGADVIAGTPPASEPSLLQMYFPIVELPVREDVLRRILVHALLEQ
jgi:hypothetical protein